MNIAWLTDIHLNFLRYPEIWWKETVNPDYDAYLLTGDLTTGSALEMTLDMLATCQKPVYWIAGNHDFYGRSIEKTRQQLSASKSKHKKQNLHYLTNEGVIQLAPETALIGDDSWYDGRNGDFARSDVDLNDFRLIEEFKNLSKDSRLMTMQKYADASALRIGKLCQKACSVSGLETLYVAVHVPPFANAAWHMGRPSDMFFQPFFSSQVMGEAIVDATAEFRVCGGKVIVLCGHSHGAGVIHPSAGLECRTGGADYGNPKIFSVLSI